MTGNSSTFFLARRSPALSRLLTFRFSWSMNKSRIVGAKTSPNRPAITRAATAAVAIGRRVIHADASRGRGAPGSAGDAGVISLDDEDTVLASGEERSAVG